MERTLYDVLEVSPKASPETIRAAYKSLLQRYHPDKHGDNPRRAAQAKEMIQAYQVLSDTKARVAYDWELRARRSPPKPPPPKPPPQPAAAPAPPLTPKPAAAPAARLPLPLTRWLAPLAWALCIGLLLLLSGFLLLPLFDPGPHPAVKPPPSAETGRDAAATESGVTDPDLAAPAAPHATQALKDWLLAYRRLDGYARAAEVKRLVNNGTLPLLPADGRFFADPRAMRQAVPALIEGPAALGRDDALALEALQSWWLAPRQLNVLVLNDLQPQRPLAGFIFELATGACAAADALGAVAVDLGRRPLQAGEGALVQVSLAELPAALYAEQSCGTIVSANYGSAQLAQAVQPPD